MRKSITILAACGLALGAAACGKHDDASSANVSTGDNMLVPADENASGADLGNSADATDNSAAAMGNDAGNAAAGNAQ